MSPSVTVRLLATQSDARLVELARQGHERAFEALVLRYRKPLLAYCRRVLLPEARAEDALQQALLQAWLALERGDEVRDARAWLYRIVRNTALNALRGSGYDYAELSEALSGSGAPHEDLDRRIAVREALAGLAALPPQQREALLRTAVEGASHADAAAGMGLSEGALRGLLYRARATLRTAVTALTPMPLATWAAGAAEHGGAVADLAVGGGSAGVAGLIFKGGAVAVTAGVLALGAGTAARRHRPHAQHRAAHASAASRAESLAGPIAVRRTAAIAPGGASEPAPRTRSQSGRHGRAVVHATPRHTAPSQAGPVRLRRDGGGPPRHGTSEGDGNHGDGGAGPGPGTRHGGDRVPGAGPGSGDGGHDGSGGGATGGSDDGHDGGATGGDGGSGTRSGDGGTSGSGTSEGSGTSGDGGTSGSGSGTSGDGGAASPSGGDG